MLSSIIPRWNLMLCYSMSITLKIGTLWIETNVEICQTWPCPLHTKNLLKTCSSWKCKTELGNAPYVLFLFLDEQRGVDTLSMAIKTTAQCFQPSFIQFRGGHVVVQRGGGQKTWLLSGGDNLIIQFIVGYSSKQLMHRASEISTWRGRMAAPDELTFNWPWRNYK